MKECAPTVIAVRMFPTHWALNMQEGAGASILAASYSDEKPTPAVGGVIRLVTEGGSWRGGGVDLRVTWVIMVKCALCLSAASWFVVKSASSNITPSIVIVDST